MGAGREAVPAPLRRRAGTAGSDAAGTMRRPRGSQSRSAREQAAATSLPCTPLFSPQATHRTARSLHGEGGIFWFWGFGFFAA